MPRCKRVLLDHSVAVVVVGGPEYVLIGPESAWQGRTGPEHPE